VRQRVGRYHRSLEPAGTSPQILTDHTRDFDGSFKLDSLYLLCGSVRVRNGPAVDAIVARLLDYREDEFEIATTEVEDGEIDLTIDGCCDLTPHDMLRLEDHLQVLGPHAREGAIFRLDHDHDTCYVIVAPSIEAGRIALSRLRLEEFRLMLGDLVPDDRARLLDDLRGLPEYIPTGPITPNNPPRSAVMALPAGHDSIG
jgi:hypothetical protein